MQVRILEDAEKDIEEGYWFYERQSQGLGDYFIDSIYSDIDSLVYFGGIHRKVFSHYRLLSKRFPFAIYYQLGEDFVVVKAVLDCRRKPSWIREKLI